MPHPPTSAHPVALGLLALAMVLPSSAAAQAAFPDDDAVRESMERRLAPQGTPGAVVGIVEADGTRRLIAWGTAGEGRNPLSARSAWEIGSISKAFNGILLAEMVGRGEVALDAPVADDLPEGTTLAVTGRPITYADLATHRSGLPRLPDNLQMVDPLDPYATYTEEALWSFVDGHEPARAPDELAEYSNVGAGLVGHLLPRVAGAPDWEALLRDRVLEPLGMSATGTDRDWSEADRVAAHDLTGTEVPWWDFPALTATGGLRSTPEDLFRFLEANLRPPEGPLGDAIRESHEDRADAGNGLRIGLFWHILPIGNRRIVWHNGGTGGTRTFLGFDPEAGTGVFVLTNSAHGADDLGLNLLVPAIPLQIPQPRNPAVEVDAAVLRSYVGTYRLAPTFAIEVTVREGRLVVQATGQPAFPTVAESDVRFRLEGVEAAIEFEIGEDGVPTALILHQAGAEQRAPRVEG